LFLFTFSTEKFKMFHFGDPTHSLDETDIPGGEGW
jgi:hypothetical protein